MFSDVSAFEMIADNKAVEILRNMRDSSETPEHIDESPETAPSNIKIKDKVGVICDRINQYSFRELCEIYIVT